MENHKNIVKVLRDRYGLSWSYIAHRVHCDTSTLRMQYKGSRPTLAIKHGLTLLLAECKQKQKKGKYAKAEAARTRN